VNIVDIGLIAAATLLAIAFRPWSALRTPALRNPWVAVLVLLPCLWGAQGILPTTFPLQLSGACLLVLMFGWPLAVLTLLPIAMAGAWLGGGDLTRAVQLAAWNGVVPATAALAIGIATRRWLPKQVFVYILARGFLGTVLAMSLAGALRVWWLPRLPGSSAVTLLTAAWLIAWGEAFITGAFTAIFVAFRPEWLLTYSDARYLPPPAR
jgi:uncharacterized membrane protein